MCVHTQQQEVDTDDHHHLHHHQHIIIIIIPLFPVFWPFYLSIMPVNQPEASSRKKGIATSLLVASQVALGHVPVGRRPAFRNMASLSFSLALSFGPFLPTKWQHATANQRQRPKKCRTRSVFERAAVSELSQQPAVQTAQQKLSSKT